MSECLQESDRKRILVLINNDVGLYKFRKELLEAIISSGFELYISLPDGGFIKDMIDLGCRFINTPIDRRGVNPFKDIKLISKYRLIIREIMPDLVLTYTIKPNVYGGIMCRAKRVPYISTITGLGSSFEGKGILKTLVTVLYRSGLKKAAAVFFQNESNLSLFKELGIGRNYHLVPGSGVNLELHQLEDYPENGVIRFLFIGRMMREKGIYELINAMRGVKSRHSNVSLDLLGSCDENCEADIKAAERDGIVSWHGQQDDVHRYIKNSFATILPSYHEGMANVLLESAASGRPVLASDIPGCRETFIEGVTGFGFNAKDAASLENAMERFIRLSYEEKKAMGLAGHNKIKQEFDRNIVVTAYMQQIKETVGDSYVID